MKDELLTIVSIICAIGIILAIIGGLGCFSPKLPTCTVTDLVNKEIVVCTYKDKVLFHGEVEK